MADDQRYVLADADEQTERERLGHLEAWLDPVTVRHLEVTGVGEGWRSLEVGAGGGSIARWLGERVGASGSVLATDIDIRYLAGLPATSRYNVTTCWRTSWRLARSILCTAERCSRTCPTRVPVSPAWCKRWHRVAGSWSRRATSVCLLSRVLLTQQQQRTRSTKPFRDWAPQVSGTRSLVARSLALCTRWVWKRSESMP